MSKRVSTVAVDFDGVLHDYLHGWADGTIYGDWQPGAREALAALMDRYAVFVHTTRDAAQVAEWIEHRSGGAVRCTTECRWRAEGPATFWNEQGVLLVTNRKLPAVAYIDDRAIRFTDWDQALADLDAAAQPGG